MKREFVEDIERAMERMGYDNRSRFIRDAITEKLGRSGYPVPPDHAAAPRRTGRDATFKTGAYELNEKPASSKGASPKETLAKSAGAKGQRELGVPGRKRKRRADESNAEEP